MEGQLVINDKEINCEIIQKKIEARDLHTKDIDDIYYSYTELFKEISVKMNTYDTTLFTKQFDIDDISKKRIDLHFICNKNTDDEFKIIFKNCQIERAEVFNDIITYTISYTITDISAKTVIQPNNINLYDLLI